VLVIPAAAMLDATARSGADCDRVCLAGFLDAYAEAFAARDPARLSVAADVRFTENGRELALGDGAWQTAGALIAYRDDLLDPVTGGAARLTAYREGDSIAQLFVRLAVADRRITEIETIVVRSGDVGWFAPENLERLSDVFATPLDAAARHSREALIAAARAYFTAVETEGTPGFVPAPFAPGMNRIENGLQTTNVRQNALSERHTWSADQQLERAAYRGTVIPDRRYPIVDTEHGSVLALAVFRFASGAGIQAAEIFKVTDGELREIRAILRNLPEGGDTGWPATPPLPRYEVKRATGAITIDGNPDDPAWSGASPAVTLQFLWDDQTGAKQQTYVQLLRDDKALYAAFRADDADISAQFTNRDDATFLDDAVEIFINPARDQEAVYYGFEMNARGILYDYLNYESRTLFGRFDATGVEVGVMLQGTLNDPDDVDDGWTLEIAIPWENFERLSRRPMQGPGRTRASCRNRRQCVIEYMTTLAPKRSARFALSAGYRGSSAHCQASATSLLCAISTMSRPSSSNTPRQFGFAPSLPMNP
jgi:hypothetical protein